MGVVGYLASQLITMTNTYFEYDPHFSRLVYGRGLDVEGERVSGVQVNRRLMWFTFCAADSNFSYDDYVGCVD